MNVSFYPVDNFQIVPGYGVSGWYADKKILVGSKDWLLKNNIHISSTLSELKSSDIHVAFDNRYLGSIEIADKIRNESKRFIQELHKLHIFTILLSGDNSSIADQIGTELRVNETHGSLFPMDKAEWVDKYKNEGRTIAMIGDGINDALAIKSADIGIAMGSGTDFTKETADIILLGNDLGKFTELVKLSKRTKRTILENFYGTILIDTIGMILAGIGILTPIIAAFVHVSSELIFIFNSARLIPYNKKTVPLSELNSQSENLTYSTKSIHDLSPL